MATLGELRSQIARDLLRSNLAADIAKAIDAAIGDIEINRFWFNETRNFTFLTTPGVADYTLTLDGDNGIEDFIKVDWINTTIGGQVRNLTQRADSVELNYDIEQDNGDGQPYEWGFYGGKFRLYPVPSEIYSIRIAGHYRLIKLTEPDQINAWTTHGFEAVRSQAAARVAIRPVRNKELAADFNGIAQSEVEKLRIETDRRISTNVIRPLRGGF